MPGRRTIDYVVAALYRLGGSSRSIDIEDIAMESYKLAPQKFRWRKYVDQIDMAGVRDGLSDARKEGLVVGNRKHGWTLTSEGRRLAAIQSESFGDGEDATGDRLRLDVPVRAAERQRVLHSRAYRKAASGSIADVTPQEIRELLRVDRYVTSEKYGQRLAIVLSAFDDDPETQDLIDQLDQMYRQGA